MRMRWGWCAALAVLTACGIAGPGRADIRISTEFFRVCSSHGAGFAYVPGTDSCLRIAADGRAEMRAAPHDRFKPRNAEADALCAVADPGSVYIPMTDQCGRVVAGRYSGTDLGTLDRLKLGRSHRELPASASAYYLPCRECQLQYGSDAPGYRVTGGIYLDWMSGNVRIRNKFDRFFAPDSMSRFSTSYDDMQFGVDGRFEYGTRRVRGFVGLSAALGQAEVAAHRSYAVGDDFYGNFRVNPNAFVIESGVKVQVWDLPAYNSAVYIAPVISANLTQYKTLIGGNAGGTYQAADTSYGWNWGWGAELSVEFAGGAWEAYLGWRRIEIDDRIRIASQTPFAQSTGKFSICDVDVVTVGLRASFNAPPPPPPP